jgi:hypothetical protein
MRLLSEITKLHGARITFAALATALACGGTEPSDVDITGEWHIVARSHAVDLTAEQQTCTLDHGLTIRSDTISSALGGVHGTLAVGDTTGTFQCVLHGVTYPPNPRFQGALFVVTRSGARVDVYSVASGALTYGGVIIGEDRMEGEVGPEVLGIGTWEAVRR